MNAPALERRADPRRFAEIERRHRRAFAWEPQGWIPLGIHVANPEYVKGLSYDRWLDPEPFLDVQTRYLIDTLDVGSDLLPVVAINHTGDAGTSSLFGAKMFMPETASATLQDVGPTPLPVFGDIREAAAFGVPPLSAGIQPELERMALHYRRHLPDWVEVVGPMPSGPVSLAMELRGSAFLLDLVDEPGLCRRLIDACADTQVAVERRLCELLGTPPDRRPTNFGIRSPGMRLGEDSLCHLSPAMIREFAGPPCRRINAAWGGTGHVHFCSLPHSRHEHIYEALLGMPEVSVVSSQFGFEFYERRLKDLRGRLAVEAFYGAAYRHVRAVYGGFREWANDFVPRFRNESGLVLYFQVESVEEGRELWAAWQEAHRRGPA